MTSSNNETLGQTKQRHKLELRAFQKKAKKDRLSKKEVEAQLHNHELKAFETKEEIQRLLFLTQNEAAEAANLATKQAKDQAKALS
ncbi:hypothetical protein PsorP6_006176 [Peronosclerospora sorghi]|uniref:Uncharacterized protein n=1 Tax=Peronosclerospora sorghi TaxID=230839 RepID=A0ACC0W443_9STRA|nr:hypothetical protein PsorP6_006176 [Peronosclerospora sorghi]